jgi:hypothetical protein
LTPTFGTTEKPKAMKLWAFFVSPSCTDNERDGGLPSLEDAPIILNGMGPTFTETKGTEYESQTQQAAPQASHS